MQEYSLHLTMSRLYNRSSIRFVVFASFHKFRFLN